MKKTIKHQYFFPHSPQTVWEYLTKPDLMEQWLMKNDFQPVIGAEFQFHTDSIPDFEFDGIFYCKVLELVPLKKLSYSWNSGPGKGKINLESIVTWDLKATDKGTDVFLEHSGFENDINLGIFNALNVGWVGKFPKIEKLINTALHGTTQA